MMLYKNKSGYVGSYGMIKYVGIWEQSLFQKDAEILFYPYNTENLVDVWGVNEKDFDVYIYPHNHKDMSMTCAKKEEIIRALHKEGRERYPTRYTFTIDVERERLLYPEDFLVFSASSSYQYNIFAFETKTGDSTFPFVFCVENQQYTGDFRRVFDTQVFTSHYVAKAAGKHTVMGKNLTYLLANNMADKGFVPNISMIDFPTSGREVVPTFLKTGNLEKFMDKCGVGSVVASSIDVPLLPAPADPLVSEPTESSTSFVSESADTIAKRIQRQVLDRKEISLMDLMGLGVKETFSALPLNDEIIPVAMDIGGIARKMCVFHQKIYVLPALVDTDWTFILGGNSTDFIECTDETYPLNYK